MKKVICPKCGASWNSNIRSCPDCETSLVGTKCDAKTISCPHCKTENYNYSTLCFQCHKSLKEMPKQAESPNTQNIAVLSNESSNTFKEMYLSNSKSKLFLGCIALICIVVCVITGMITYNAGSNKSLNQAAVNEMANRLIETDNKYQDELKTLTEEHEEKLAAIVAERVKKTAELSDLKQEVSSNEKIIKEMNEYNANKEALNAEIIKKQSTISSLDAKIKVKSDELDFLTGKAAKAVSDPKRLGAGVFTVGTDLTPGRYSVTGSSNFVVYDSTGSLKVNTILGSGRYAVANYTCNLEIGDEMELDSACVFTPIE